MKEDLHTRKATRLYGFDYSLSGAYFVTICIRDRKEILSKIVKSSVGKGLAPPANTTPPQKSVPEYKTQLMPCGEIAKEQLILLEKRYKGVSVTDYVIMPDHIHAIIVLSDVSGGASPSPTLNDIVCAYKSLTSRICKQQFGVEKLFQRSFYDHIIRDADDYETRKRYIIENPMRRYYKQNN